MKFKRLRTGLLVATILSLSTITAFGADVEGIKSTEITESIEATTSIATPVNVETPFAFGSFTGTVKEINDFTPVEGAKIIAVENTEGMPANIVVSKETYIVNGAEITVGSVITGYYNANAPMILIYPPQYNAQVVVVHSNDYNVKVDVFDKDLVSQDHSLKLNISDDTEIVSVDGTPFKGELGGRKLVVIYTISTKSIPAQTTPTKIIVLPKEKEAPTPDVSKMDIMVNNQKINAPKPYTNDKGVVMVPLRPIAQALKFDVKWDGKTQTIMVGKGTYLTIGKDEYIYMKTAPIVLGTAPELRDGTTFVPLSFFKEVMREEGVDVI